MTTGSAAHPRFPRALVVVAAAVVLVGLFTRWRLSTGAIGRLNADEAISGLMARALLNGDWSTFYWGQHYGGTAELLVLAPLLAVIGNAALWILPLLESLLVAALVFRIARRFLTHDRALLAAALTWSAPALWVWFSMRPMLFYQPAMIAGLLLIDLVHPARTSHRWMLIGLVAGIGWWTSPQVLFIALPACAALISIRPTRSQWMRLVAGSVIGAAPWLLVNLTTRLASLRAGPPASGTIAERLQQQLEIGWPMSLGLRTPFHESWVLAGGPVLALVVGGALAAAIVVTIRRYGWNAAIVLTPVAFVPLQMLAPTGSYVGSGRYYVFIIPSIAVAVVAALDRVSPFVVTAVASVLVALSVAGTEEIRDWRMEPTGVEMVAHRLADEGHRAVIADYWSAYLLAWYEPDLVVMPTYTERQPSWSAEVMAATKVANVVWTGDPNDAARLGDLLAADPPPSAVEQWGDWTVVVSASAGSP